MPIIARLHDEKEQLLVFANDVLLTQDLLSRAVKHVPTLRGRVGVVHAALTGEQRVKVGQLFNDGDLDVLFCTQAFEMGINTPNVNNVVNYH